MLQIRSILLFILAVVSISGRPGAAQEAYAAVVQVVYPGVEIQRAQTEEWLPLAVGSVTPFGAGDQLRTDDTGRVRVTFWDGAEMLVLSNSTYQLTTLEIANDTAIQLSGTLSGVAVHHITTASSRLSYELTVQDVVIIRPGTLFATWSHRDQPVSLTVADGSVELVAEDNVVVHTGQGFFRNNGVNEVIRFDQPWNAAQMQGLIEGCPGMVNTIGSVALRVRLGPGLGYLAMGEFEYQQSVRIMAINESRGWYRIPFLGGFGWVLRLAVETDCQNLPVLPDDTLETSEYVIDAVASEIELLRPFFGLPSLNGWFYQWTASSPSPEQQQ